MDSDAPGLWARRVAPGATGWSEATAARRGADVVVEMRQPDHEAVEVERPHGMGDVPVVGRRQVSVAGGVPDGTARSEVRGDTAPGESARRVLVNAVADDQPAERIEAVAGGEEGWPAAGGTRAQVAAGEIERKQEPMDLRGLIETVEERRARVEACR